MNTCIFTNDNNVSLQLIDHPFSQIFVYRDLHEALFRKIHTYLILSHIIKNNIIDLGAWIGDNSIPWAKNIDGVVYAIDPSPDNCYFIEKICEENKITNVKIIPQAISDKNEVLSTNDHLHHCSFVYGNYGVNGKTKLNAVSLDYLYEMKEIENIGYIHLDVEGMEYRVLQGSSHILDVDRPIISFEQHLETDDYGAILVYLTNKKYTIFLINEILPGCKPDCRNSLAFPNELYNDAIIYKIHEYLGINILIRIQLQIKSF